MKNQVESDHCALHGLLHQTEGILLTRIAQFGVLPKAASDRTVSIGLTTFFCNLILQEKLILFRENGNVNFTITRSLQSIFK